jgi:hypothetical protein
MILQKSLETEKIGDGSADWVENKVEQVSNQES